MGWLKRRKLWIEFVRMQTRGLGQDSQKPMKSKLDEMNRFGSLGSCE